MSGQIMSALRSTKHGRLGAPHALNSETSESHCSFLSRRTMRRWRQQRITPPRQHARIPCDLENGRDESDSLLVRQIKFLQNRSRRHGYSGRPRVLLQRHRRRDRLPRGGFLPREQMRHVARELLLVRELPRLCDPRQQRVRRRLRAVRAYPRHDQQPERPSWGRGNRTTAHAEVIRSNMASRCQCFSTFRK